MQFPNWVVSVGSNSSLRTDVTDIRCITRSSIQMVWTNPLFILTSPNYFANVIRRFCSTISLIWFWWQFLRFWWWMTSKIVACYRLMDLLSWNCCTTLLPVLSPWLYHKMLAESLKDFHFRITKTSGRIWWNTTALFTLIYCVVTKICRACIKKLYTKLYRFKLTRTKTEPISIKILCK